MMQMMTTKPAVNISMPLQILEAYESAAARVGKKKKWMVVSAALSQFLTMPLEQQEALIREIASADVTGNFSNLLKIRTASVPAPIDDIAIIGGETPTTIPTELAPPESSRLSLQEPRKNQRKKAR